MTPRELAEQLRNMARRLSSGNAQDAFREQAVKILEDSTLENFERSEDPDGVPWLPLKRPRPDGTKKPLVKTGLLRDSFAGLLRGNLGPKFAGSFTSSLLRESVPYAIFHQLGTKRIPQRRFFGVGKKVKVRLKTAASAWLLEWVKGDVLAG